MFSFKLTTEHFFYRYLQVNSQPWNINTDSQSSLVICFCIPMHFFSFFNLSIVYYFHCIYMSLSEKHVHINLKIPAYLYLT